MTNQSRRPQRGTLTVNGQAAAQVVLAAGFDAYCETGDASAIVCLMCQRTCCDRGTCLPFGSPEYFARLDQLHGRNREGEK